MENRDEYEAKHIGGYTRIYPDKEYEKYSEFIAAAENEWQIFYGYKKRGSFRISMKLPTSASKLYRKGTINGKHDNKKSVIRSAEKKRSISKIPKYNKRNRENSSRRSSITHAEDFFEPSSVQQEEPLKDMKLKEIRFTDEDEEIGRAHV